MYDKIALGNYIRENREKKKLTIEMLAEQCDLSTKSISNIELGKSVPRIDNVLNIFHVLKIGTNGLEKFY